MEIRDRDGWRLSEGSRCFRFTQSGIRLKGQAIVVGFTNEGDVEVENMKTLARGVARPGDLKLIGRTKDKPKNLVRWERDRAVMADVSERVQRRKKGALR